MVIRHQMKALRVRVSSMAHPLVIILILGVYKTIDISVDLYIEALSSLYQFHVNFMISYYLSSYNRKT